MRALERGLREGSTELGLTLDDAQIAQLLDYLDLIQKWTKVYNLTALREPADMLTHHLLDSLAVVVPLRAELTRLGRDGPSSAAFEGGATERRANRLLDVGSGAGLPGVVIAICCPEVLVDCVDTVAKKAAFVRQVAATLKLPNLRGLHARVENLTEQYEVVGSRAFASLSDFVSWSQGALAANGVWMAMKGKRPDSEIASVSECAQVFHVEHLTVPGLEAERCIVWMRRT